MDKIAFVISMISLAVYFFIMLSGILSNGMKGLKAKSKSIGLSFLIYAVTFLLFLVMQ